MGKSGKMMMLAAREGERRSRGGMEYPDMARSRYPIMGDHDGIPMGRFTDNRGRTHYDNGRFAPMGTTWQPDSYPDGMPVQMGFVGPAMNSGRAYDFDVSGSIEDKHPGGMGNRAVMYPGKMTKEMAKRWVSQMVGDDGTIGEHWTMEQTEQVRNQRGLVECDPNEFYVSMNLMWSDYGTVAKRMGVGNTDFFAEMAKAFLHDKDSVDGKLMAYYSAIVK